MRKRNLSATSSLDLTDVATARQIGAYVRGNIKVEEQITGRWIMRYEVRAVADCKLPDGIDWAWARLPEGVFLFVKRARMASPEDVCRVMTAAFTAWVAAGCSASALPMVS